MPYILQEDRPILNSQIEQVMDVIVNQKDLLMRMELAGFFAHEVIRGFVGNLTRPHSVFNCLFFDKKDKYDVSQAADKTVEHLTRKNIDLLKQAGEINYVISAVGWGALGLDDRLPEAKYAQRAYWRATIAHIRDKYIENCGNIRKYLMLYGVLSDVIDEAYRRHTAKYEDKKIEENGDVWPLTCDLASSLPEAVVVS